MPSSAYAHIISEFSDNGPAVVEELIRLQHPTLDHLTREDFKHECAIADGAIELDPALLKA